MSITDEDLLKMLEDRFPIYARLETMASGSRSRFELTDGEGNEINIDGVSPLRIIALLRKYGYPEEFEEIAAFDGQIVFGLLVVTDVRTKRKKPHQVNDSPFFRNFF